MALLTVALCATLFAPPGSSAAAAAPPAPAVAPPHVPADDLAYTPVSKPVFNNPAVPAAQYAVVNQLVRNINGSPRGSTITLTAYSYALQRVTDALASARRRGVVIRTLISAHSLVWKPATDLAVLLNANTTDSSFAMWARGSTRVAGGTMHQKTWMFSQVGKAHWVTMVGSQNLTDNGAENQYSDMIMFANRPDIYGIFNAVFKVQIQRKPQVQPYIQAEFAGGDVFFLPMLNWSPSKDPVINRIKNLPPTGARIDVAAYSWWNYRGAEIARALAAKQRAGARVYAVVGPSASQEVRNILKSAGVSVRLGYFPNGNHIHSKIMMASYVRPGQARIWKVWTGSDNWANESLGHDEVSLGYRSKGLWEMYLHFLSTIPNSPVV